MTKMSYIFYRSRENTIQKKERRNFKMNSKFNNAKGITLIALVITILFSYDEKLKCSNSKGFLLATI